MKDQIKEHIEGLFKGAPRTRRIADLQEELLSGCLDKYEDLISSGVTEQAAYDAVIAGIGDIDELTGEARGGPPDKKLLGPASSALWSLVTLIFLCLGFVFKLWHPGWLIFLIGAIAQNLLGAVFAGKDNRKNLYTGSLYIGAALAFLFIGFWTNKWIPAVLIFALAVTLQQILRLLRLWRDDS
jgi:hypothetical protein